MKGGIFCPILFQDFLFDFIHLFFVLIETFTPIFTPILFFRTTNIVCEKVNIQTKPIELSEERFDSIHKGIVEGFLLFVKLLRQILRGFLRRE